MKYRWIGHREIVLKKDKQQCSKEYIYCDIETQCTAERKIIEFVNEYVYHVAGIKYVC